MTRLVKTNKRVAYVAFCDFSKAFDKVNRKKLLWQLKDKLDPYIWLSIRNYYEVSVACTFTLANGFSRFFRTTVGVKQGGQMSPDLYGKYTNDMLVLLERSGFVAKIVHIVVGRLGYADDTSIITTTVTKLNAALKIVEDYSVQYDIQINQKKTECLKLGEPVPLDGSVPVQLENEKVIFGGVVINKCNKFKFLGMWVTPNLNNGEHLKKRKGAVMSIMPELNNLGFNNEKLLPEAKGTLVQAFIRPRLLYGTENCNLTEGNIKELIKFEARIIKHSYGLASRTMNGPLISALGIKPLRQAIIERQYSFVMQLVANLHTRELVLLNDLESPIQAQIGDLNINWDDGSDDYARAVEIHDKCHKKLEEMKAMDKIKLNNLDKLSRVTRFLLENRSPENDEALRHLTHSQNRVTDPG